MLVSLKSRVRAARPKPTSLYIVFSVPLHKIYILLHNKGELEKRFPALGNNLLHQHMCAACGCDILKKKNNILFEGTELDRHI